MRRHGAHYDVTVMNTYILDFGQFTKRTNEVALYSGMEHNGSIYDRDADVLAQDISNRGGKTLLLNCNGEIRKYP